MQAIGTGWRCESLATELTKSDRVSPAHGPRPTVGDARLAFERPKQLAEIVGRIAQGEPVAMSNRRKLMPLLRAF
jgi:hypothetical protein